MEIGMVRRIDIDKEMQQAYLSYAMSVIVSRALPDARDGLKPVHRRILYAMHDMRLRPDTPYRKSARIVGEVLGKYHPHSDQAVYDAMARMAQNFSMRYLLVDGQGNFGSVDGDPPAAMRYTEARLATASVDMLNDLEKETVDFQTNFDDSLTEPTVLPAAIPNLLVNGAAGIAVGMSTSVPPHNLTEVCNAAIHMIEHWGKLDDVTIGDLMQIVEGPDFPTGGVVVVSDDPEQSLEAAYGRGRGKITVQAKANVEEMARGRNRIIVTDLPYQVNRSALVSRIADLAREGRVEGLTDLRDESDRNGNRIVIELAAKVDPDKMLAQLFKLTPLQSTFSIIMLALVDGEPRTLSLKQMLKVFIDHRLEIIRRRSEYDLARARERAHILEGYLIALDALDEVIRIIRNSQNAETARQRLMKTFSLSEIQATAILDMPLRRLTRLDVRKIKDEYKEIKQKIAYLEALLASPGKMRGVVVDELEDIKARFGDERRTVIVRASGRTSLRARDLVPEETVTVSITASGRVSRMSGGRMKLGREAPVAMLTATTRHTLYVVADDGQAVALAVHTLPETTDIGDGAPLSSLTQMPTEARLAAAVAIPPEARSNEEHPLYITLATSAGMVKKSAVTELPGPSVQVFTAIRVNDGDAVLGAQITSGDDNLLLVTERGQGIHFSEADVRPMGLVAAGVGGIKLGKTDRVVGFSVADPEAEVLLVCNDGMSKRTPVGEYPTQGRNGKGVQAWKLPKTRELVAGYVVDPRERMVLVSTKGRAKAFNNAEAPRRSRSANGQQTFARYHEDDWATMTTTLPLVKLDS